MQTFPVSKEDEGKVSSVLGYIFAIKMLIICLLFSIPAFTTPSKCFFFLLIVPKSLFKTSSNVFFSFKLLLFVLDLQDEPKGLSLGGCVIINKSLSLTVGTSRICLHVAHIELRKMQRNSQNLICTRFTH